MNFSKMSVLVVFSAILFGCGGDDLPSDPEVRDYSSIFAPLPESPVYPPDNPFSAAKQQLGEFLYWDPILSGDQNVACASCHHPDFGWADGRPLSVGSDGIGLGPARHGSQVTPLHSPTIMNVAFTGIKTDETGTDFVSGGYFWDLRTNTLEEQALGPIKNPVEMLGYNLSEEQIMQEIVLRLSAIPEYVELFEQAFGAAAATAATGVINPENIAKAIATFERRIISPNTRFDDFLSGDLSALEEREVIGLNKFIDGGCTNCHSGPMLSDNQLDPDSIVMGGRAVRTPSLRNLSFTAPYMHDGSRATLRSAIADYEDRGDLDTNIGEGDFGDIEAFLRTLDTEKVYQNQPDYVPSGLPVGGDI